MRDNVVSVASLTIGVPGKQDNFSDRPLQDGSCRPRCHSNLAVVAKMDSSDASQGQPPWWCVLAADDTEVPDARREVRPPSLLTRDEGVQVFVRPPFPEVLADLLYLLLSRQADCWLLRQRGLGHGIHRCADQKVSRC